jgi:hypothetical protein
MTSRLGGEEFTLLHASELGNARLLECLRNEALNSLLSENTLIY